MFQTISRSSVLADRCGRSIRPFAAIVVSLSLLSSSAVSAQQGDYYGGGGRAAPPNWEIDSVVSKCVASVAGGAILGAIIGGATGRNNNAGMGAVFGAAAGGALCAVISALDEQDRARIRAAQIQAARTGQPQRVSYRGQDGLERQVEVRVTDVGASAKPSSAEPAKRSQAQVAAASGQRICRTLNTNVSVQTKGETDVPAQVVCRTPNGDYEPA